jgi:hypothetical protein
MTTTPPHRLPLPGSWHRLGPVGPDGASRRARALEIFDRVPELETWTYGPEAHCDDAVRAELLA